MWKSRRAHQHGCMCGSKRWWSLSLLCDGRRNPPPSVLFAVLFSVISTCCHKHTRTHLLCGWLHAIWGSCMQSVPSDTWPWQHELHSADSLIGLAICYIATTIKKIERTYVQSFVLILGCREGWVKWVGRDWHLRGFLPSFIFGNSLLTWQDSVMHVKTQF